RRQRTKTRTTTPTKRLRQGIHLNRVTQPRPRTMRDQITHRTRIHPRPLIHITQQPNLSRTTGRRNPIRPTVIIASRSINGIDDFLVWMPWWVFILIIFALGWYFQSLLSGVIFGIFIFLIGTFGLWGDMMTTIAIILAAVGISLIVGIPMGVWMS